MKIPLVVAIGFMATASLGYAAKPVVWRPPAGKKAYDPAKDKVLYEVGYSHLDTQWRWSYLDTIGTYIPNTMHDNFALFEKYPNYQFSFSGSNRYHFMKEYYPKDFAKVKEYIAKNRWHVSGSSVEENDVNVPSSESIVRQLLYGNHFFEKEMGATSIDFILPDCFGFPASLPSILAHSGIKGFSTQKLTWGYPYPIPFTVGNWYGPDGRYVTSALDAGSYNSRITEDLSQSQSALRRINNIGDKSGAYVDFRYFGIGDEGGAPAETSAQWMERILKSNGPVTVVASPSDQIFKDLTPKQISKLPTYKGELELTQHSAGSLSSQAYMKRWNRKNELLADSAERASVAADWLGAVKYPHQHMNDTWRLILGGQFHDILPGTSIPKAYEFSWNDEVVALNQSASALTDGAGAVIRAMDTRGSGVPVVVYNPLSIVREDVVDATVRLPKPSPSVRVFGPDGKEVASQVVGRSGASVHLLFLAKAPSVGFATYDVRPSAKPCAISNGLKVTGSTLENKRYAVTLNSNGDVSQITDKANGRGLLSAPARLAYRYEQPDNWPAWNMDWRDQSAPSVGYVVGPAKVRVIENGPVRVALQVTRETGASKFVQVIRLAAAGAGNRVEFDNTINWNERKTTLKTEFPLAVSNENATYNLGMGTITRKTDDPNSYEFGSHEWFDLTDASGKYGVSVLEDCKFGSDKPDDHTLRLTLIRTPGARSYEDQATQDIGRHRVLYALSGHNGTWKGKTPWEAARLNQPLVAFQSPAHSGRLGKAFSLFSVSTPQVAISAIKQAEDSSDIIVRLQELSGAPANVTLTAAAPISAAREVNGQERTIGNANLKNGSISLKIDGYNPRAFAVRLARTSARMSAPVSVPVALPYNVVAAGYDGRAEAKGFDGLGRTFPVEMFPGTFSSDGVTFKMGKVGPGAKTAVACNGQTLRLPAGSFKKVYVLASAIGGDKKGTFVVGRNPVPTTVQDWGGFIGQWDNRIWERPASAPGLQRLDGGIYGLVPAYIKRDPIAYMATHRHTAKGGNDIYAYAYVFKYGFDIPAGATTLTLPKQPGIRVLAVSVARDTNDGAQPAQYLYDSFDASEATPSILPAGGQFADTTEVTVRPSLYDALSTIHYTTDGTEPTAASPVYNRPIPVAKDTTVRVRAFHGDNAAGPVVAASFQVDDRTPPTLQDVVAAAGSPLIRLSFSEVLGASASTADNYKVDGLTVQSAVPTADGRSVDLTVTPAPAPDKTYSLKIDGVTDLSPNANAVALGAGREFTAVSPIMALTVSGTESKVTPESLVVNVLGAPTIVAEPRGPVLSFDGSQDAVVIDDAPELNPTAGITIAAWVKATDWNGNRRIVQKGSNDDQYRFTAEQRQLVFDLSGVGTVQCALPTIGVWHHLAGTYDGHIMRVYIDGKVVGETEASGLIATTDNALNIGTKTSRSAAADHLVGELADLRIYDKALLPAHLAALAAK